MRKSAFLLALLCATSAAHAQEPTRLKAAQVPLHGTSTAVFIPRGWRIEKQINGDLNRDQRPDAALVLVRNKPAHDDADNPTPRARALVLALRDGKSWRRAGFNNSVLLGTRDGGAFYGVVETPVNVSIQKGVVIVNQEAGSREVSETTYRFRFDQTQKRFALIGYDQTTRDRATGNVATTSINFLTGRKKITKLQASPKRTVISNSRVNRRFRLLELVHGDEVL
jgi:hypothetical protein